MLTKLKDLLNYFEDKLDEDSVAAKANMTLSALHWKHVDRLPLTCQYPYPSESKYKPFPHGEVFDDPEKMLFNQLVYAFSSSPLLSLEINDDRPITIRPDFGCVLVASVFGSNIKQVGNNPPWVSNKGENISYEKIFETSTEDFDVPLIQKVVDRYKFYHDVLRDYPVLNRCANIILPDLQGPFVNIELLRGSDVFCEMVTDKSQFLRAMDVLSEVQINLAKIFSSYISEETEGMSHQHGFMQPGTILIRTDTSIMVSSDMYKELIVPFEEKILNQLTGGIHSCGDITHLTDSFLELPSISCLDFGQSELNSYETVYGKAREKNVALIRVAPGEDELVSKSILKKIPTGVSLIFRASSLEHAKFVLKEYNKI